MGMKPIFLIILAVMIITSCVGSSSREKMNSCIRSKAGSDVGTDLMGVMAYSECVNKCKAEGWKVNHTCENDYYEEAGILREERKL